MNDQPSGDNATATASASSLVDRIPARLNLSLQQALGCLDLKLEDELSRFRDRQHDRTADRTANVANATTETWQADDPDSDIISGEIVRSAIAQSTQSDSPQEPLRERDLPQSGGFIIIDGIYPPKDERLAITHVSDATKSVVTDFVDPHASLDVNFSPRGEITYEYSASSQELLRQIQSGYTTPGGRFEAQRQPASSPAKKHKLFTPVKIGSLAAACLLAGGAAYTYFNPAILAPLTATKPIPTTATNSSLGQAIQSPNLAANEFTELNLSTLNTVKMPTAALAPSAATNPTSATPTTTGAPVAIPYNGMNNAAPTPPTTIVSQPRLADSLIRSLLPPNFHTAAKQSRYPATQPGLRR